MISLRILGGFFVKFQMPYVYSSPYVYNFFVILQAICLFPALHLFQTLENDYAVEYA